VGDGDAEAAAGVEGLRAVTPQRVAQSDGQEYLFDLYRYRYLVTNLPADRRPGPPRR
jgi:hypothetical protein